MRIKNVSLKESSYFESSLQILQNFQQNNILIMKKEKKAWIKSAFAHLIHTPFLHAIF